MIDKRLLEEVALTEAEYALIVDKLGREPNMVELGMFGAMWSEHCGYKNSRLLLKNFPTTGPRVLQGPGENAGAVDIGEGLAVVMKIESHNHPSAIEPFQGAATGVGGILRDIFTMGARPIAMLDSLRFGPLSEARNRHLFSGVVGGIGWYGNCMGVPTVAGEIYFSDSYSENPLVNAMCVGIAESRKLVRAQASGPGNTVMVVGADTGRDGIHGATFASVELNERSEERRPAVQVGNPFLEKLLLEACLELLDTDYVVGMQDLGAAGLTSSTVECASRGGAGIDIDIDSVSRRETGMTPYEVMLSESQERMLVIVRKGFEENVKAIFDKWDLHSDIIGQVTDDGIVRVRDGGQVVAEIPAHILTDEVPAYRREGRRASALDDLNRLDLSAIPEPASCGEVILRLLASPNVASRRQVYRQYDHTIQTNTMVAPGAGDAAVLSVRGTNKAIAITTDCNPRYCYLDPHRGGASAVLEAAQNVVMTGATPLAVTDCLNFGNPEKPEIYYQLEEAINGMAEACRALETPVISGNVSLYNESRGAAVYPTPVVGMVGLIEDAAKVVTMGFKAEGDVVLLAGNPRAGLGASEYLEAIHGVVGGLPPDVDLALAQRLQSFCLEAMSEVLIRSAHDCSDGGLAIAVAECCIAGGMGVSLDGPDGESDGRLDEFLFGEGNSRVLLTVRSKDYDAVARMAERYGVPLRRLGSVRGDRMKIGGSINLPVSGLATSWGNGLEEQLS